MRDGAATVTEPLPSSVTSPSYTGFSHTSTGQACQGGGNER